MNGEAALLNNLVANHSGELVILCLSVLTALTTMIVLPMILRSQSRKAEMIHKERMQALERGLEVPPPDEATWAAGRATMLVPIVVIITAGTVTCFVVAHRNEDLFAVTLSVWSVAGVVCLAAITGGVALIGRLAQLKSADMEEAPENPFENT